MDERGGGYAHTEERPGTITISVTMGTSPQDANTERATSPLIRLRERNVKTPGRTVDGGRRGAQGNARDSA